MRALICRQWGGIEQLQIGEAPMPRPGRGEVLIRVKATDKLLPWDRNIGTRSTKRW